jgi:hypothetical protein
MKILPHGSGGWQFGVVVALLAAAGIPVAASPLNVTRQTTATLNTDDALFFTLSTYSFAVNAAERGLPTLPSAVEFSFVTDWPGPSGSWDALLETPNGTVVAVFPELMEFGTAQYTSDNYTGTVGEVGGSIALTSAESQALFGNSAIVLVLQNLGSTSTVGLSSYSIAHDLTATVFGSGLSTGGVVTAVTLDDPPEPPGVPEPGSAWLLAAAALCAVTATVVKRARR